MYVHFCENYIFPHLVQKWHCFIILWISLMFDLMEDKRILIFAFTFSWSQNTVLVEIQQINLA